MLNSAPSAAFAMANRRRPRPAARKGRSQVDMAYDVLKKARAPLHVSDLLARIQSPFGVTVDRESLVSSLTKKVARGTASCAPEKNTFTCDRRPDDFAGSVPGYHRRLALASSPNSALGNAPCAKRWARWSAWAGGA